MFHRYSIFPIARYVNLQCFVRYVTCLSVEETKEKSIVDHRRDWWNSLTDEEKSARMSKAALARASKMTKEQRVAHAFLMVKSKKEKQNVKS